ncbi:MAG: LacI family DNA-binding transcriptional regulator [Armatimonadetes bacterium]|nr:LacI family DNA-binding transcriptional regulator [Armatimonadota bacterium]
MAGRGRLTMREVAREAQVSVFTVSVVLSGKGDAHRIAPATRDRVLETARRLKYRHNLYARHLSTGKSERIGILAFQLFSGVVRAKLEALSRAVAAQGHRVSLGYAAAHPEMQAQFAEEFAGSLVEGVIILAASADLNGDALEPLLDAGIPIVSLEPLPGIPIDCVTVDRRVGGYLATRHLLELGHRRIGVIHGGQASAERLQGYRQALEEFGCAPDDALLAQTQPGQGDTAYDKGLLLARELLALPSPPTAIFGNNDEIATGALKAVQGAGLRVPEDLSVVGFDNIAAAAYACVPLTTIAQPSEELARQAVGLLFDRIRGAAEGPPRMIRVPPKLVVRDSTGPAPPAARIRHKAGVVASPVGRFHLEAPPAPSAREKEKEDGRDEEPQGVHAD